MESAKVEIVPVLHSPDFTTRYVINSKVSAIQEEFDQKYISGFGDSAVFEKRSKGWFVFLEGSYEKLHLGTEKPDWKKGDKIRITMEKVNG